MNLSQKHLEKIRLQQQTRSFIKVRSAGATALKIFISLFSVILILLICIMAGILQGVLSDLPTLDFTKSTESKTAGSVFDSDGKLLYTLEPETDAEETDFSEFPQDLIDAVVTAEDPLFWLHSGFNIPDLFRYLSDVFIVSSELPEQTISQQLIGNIFFSDSISQLWNEKLIAIFQKEYLTVSMEDAMSKNEILTHYLNSLYFGNFCLGIAEASDFYFSKPVSALTLSECTVLAAMIDDPSNYDPLTHTSANAGKRSEILTKMASFNYISEEEKQAALSDPVYSRICTVSRMRVSDMSAFEDAVFTAALSDLQTQYHLTATQAYLLLTGSGIRILSTMNSGIQSIVDEETSDPSNYYSASGDLLAEYALVYGVSVQKADGTISSYNENDVISYHQSVLSKSAFKNNFQNIGELTAAAEEFEAWRMSERDTFLGESVISYTLQPQVSCVIIDQHTGYVKALSGGREANSISMINRAIDSPRDPGSVFTVLTAFAPAIDTAGASLSSTYYDSPFSVNNQQIMNWWGSQYLGYSNIRQGIKYSMNIVAEKCLTSINSSSIGFQYASRFGITTLTDADKNNSIALGDLTTGVYNLELTAAYAAIANDGISVTPVFYTQVLDADGVLLLDHTENAGERIIKSSTAALLTSAMVDTVSDNGIYDVYGIEPTGSLCQVDGMTIAGKSGTTLNSNDLWFVGYSPYYTCGIWTGYESSKSLGSGQTYHKGIWQKIMDKVHKKLSDREFVFTEQLQSAKICSKSGLLAIEGVCDGEGSNSIVYEEWFRPGTQPQSYCTRHYTLSICSDSGQSATTFCPLDHVIQKVYFRIDDNDLSSAVTTLDTAYLAPSALQSCTVHTQNR